MPLTEQRKTELESLCLQFRKEIVEVLHSIKTGHPGGSLSAVEIVTALYFEKMNIDPQNPQMEGRDRFVLSKGHAVPVLYLALAEKGFFPKEDIKTLRQIGSHLQGHPCAHKTPGIELSTGPLGLGLGASVGMAIAEKRKKSPATIYTLLGDGEIQEGVIWEACMAASKYKTDNLVAIVDYNGVQLDGPLEEIMPMGDIASKFAAFGWEVISCDGHDIAAVCDALDEAKAVTGKPAVIIAKTVKGKGVSFMEGKSTWHGRAISDDDYKAAMAELEGK